VDKKFLNEIPHGALQFVKNLKKENYEFYPFQKNRNFYGTNLNLGLSCYALKIYYMTLEHKNLSEKDLNNWLSYIKSFHSINNIDELFVDPIYLKYYNKKFSRESLRNYSKKLQIIIQKANFESKGDRLLKGLNAETKQAIATLYELGDKDSPKIYNFIHNDKQVFSYLEQLDWQFPWSAGAQFSSYCVYSKTQDLDI
jgi:hypothetical protein